MGELERFIEHWYGPWRPEHGLAASVVEQIPVADPLKRLLAFAGNWYRPDNNRWILQDHFVVYRDPAYFVLDAEDPAWVEFGGFEGESWGAELAVPIAPCADNRIGTCWTRRWNKS